MCVLTNGEDMETGTRNRQTDLVSSTDKNVPHRESEATPPSLSSSALSGPPTRYLQGKGWGRTAVKTAEVNQDYQENPRYKNSLSIF